MISHGTGNLNIIYRFVSNGELTVLADALAVHGKNLTDAGRFYLDPLNTEQENRRSRPVTELLDEWVQAKKQNRNKPLRPASVGSIQNMANDFKRALGDQTGTAKHTLKRHYIDRTTKEAAEKYWSMVPTEDGKSLVVGN